MGNVSFNEVNLLSLEGSNDWFLSCCGNVCWMLAFALSNETNHRMHDLNQFYHEQQMSKEDIS